MNKIGEGSWNAITATDEPIEVVPNKIPKTGKHLIIEEHGNRKTKKGQ